jgi:hypothetical protein
MERAVTILETREHKPRQAPAAYCVPLMISQTADDCNVTVLAVAFPEHYP